MSKIYGLSIPITGYLCVEVEADSEEEAFEKAFESEVSVNDIEEWELHKVIVEGNVFHGLRNRLEVEYVEDDGDDNE